MRLITNPKLRLNSDKNLLNRFVELNKPEPGNAVVRDIKNGKMLHHEANGGAQIRLGIITKKVIAALSVNGNSREIAAAFNITADHARTIASGVSSKSAGKNDELVQIINSKKQQIAKTALEQTMEAFGLMSEKLPETKSARELAGIAKDCAVVAEKMLPREQSESAVQVIIHSTPTREESDYKVIEVSGAEIS